MKKFLKWPVLALVIVLLAFRPIAESCKTSFSESRGASFVESCKTSFAESRVASFEESCEASFAESWSDSLIKTLTIDQKIGQLFMVAAHHHRALIL
jgi:hypothetical protein